MKAAREPKPYLTGEPYYCDTCGLAGGEISACEDGGCRMESPDAARRRRDRALRRGFALDRAVR